MKGLFGALKSEIKAVITGSQLVKGYEVEKDPYMKAGLHQLWSVYRAQKRTGDHKEVSIFMLEKKQWDKKKSEADAGAMHGNMRQEAFTTLKNEPVNLAKVRHPSMLQLVEPPLEDDKYLAFVSEPVEFSLACLAEANTTKDHLKDKIPSVLEVKVLILELMEALNFLH